MAFHRPFIIENNCLQDVPRHLKAGGEGGAFPRPLSTPDTDEPVRTY
jgi:hypothetical protein